MYFTSIITHDDDAAIFGRDVYERLGRCFFLQKVTNRLHIFHSIRYKINVHLRLTISYIIWFTAFFGITFTLPHI